MNVIKRVFDNYKKLDFTDFIPNSNGDVEVTTNILGDGQEQENMVEDLQLLQMK